MAPKGVLSMQTEDATRTWPKLDDLGEVRRLVAQAHDELERLSWAFNPLLNGNDDEPRTFEELGQLAAFVSSVSGDVDAMTRMLGQLAQARDVVVPSA